MTPAGLRELVERVPEDLERIVDAAAPWVRRLTAVVVEGTEVVR